MKDGKRIPTQPAKRNRAHIPEINIPDTCPVTRYTIIGKHILFIEVTNDTDQPNPCKDWDGVGMIRSLGRNHINNIPYDEAVELLTDPDNVALSYFEHGRSLWMVKELPAPAGVEFQWDGVRFAGVWTPDECLLDEVKELAKNSPERRAKLVEFAKQACGTYTDWVNGDVYWYRVQVFELRKGDGVYTDIRDYRFAKAIYDDSCGGFYGWDYFKGEVTDQVRYALSEIGFSKRAISKALPRNEEK